MFYREQLQKKIIDMLTIIEVSIKNRGVVNLYDQNIFAETFIANLLNIVFGYNLVNLNHEERGKTGIDLGDWTRKIAFQVTSTKDSRKIKETINKFINHDQYIYFEHLKFFILNQKQKSYTSKFETEGKFKFDSNLDIIDIQDVIKIIDSLPLEKMEKINLLIDHEFFGYSLSNESKNLTRNRNKRQEKYQVVRTVYRTEVPLYSDPECRFIRSGFSGVILEIRQQPGNILAAYTIHPTTCKHFKQGMQVAWEWNHYMCCGESWYYHPDTGDIRYAWTESAEFVGRSIND